MEKTEVQREWVNQHGIRSLWPSLQSLNNLKIHPLLWIIIGTSVVRMALVLSIYITDPGAVLAADSLRYLDPISGANSAALCSLFPTTDITLLPQIPPLYTWLLCGLDSMLENLIPGVLLLQVLLAAITTALVYYTTDTIVKSRAAATVAALLFALDPMQTYYSGIILSETTFTFLIVLAACCGTQLIVNMRHSNFHYWAMGLGVCIALCMMTRLVAHYMFIPILAGLVFFGHVQLKQSLRKLTQIALLVFLPLAIIVGSWQVRNGLVTGSYEFSSASSEIMLEWKAAGLMSVKEGISQDEALAILQQRVSGDFAGSSEQLDERWHIGVGYLLQNKADYLLWSATDLIKILAGPGAAFASNWVNTLSGAQAGASGDSIGNSAVQSAMYLLVIGYGLGYLLVTYALVAAGLVYIARVNDVGRVAMLLLLGIAAFLILIATGHASASSRFRVPAMPLLCVVAAGGFEWLRKKGTICS